MQNRTLEILLHIVRLIFPVRAGNITGGRDVAESAPSRATAFATANKKQKKTDVGGLEPR